MVINQIILLKCIFLLSPFSELKIIILVIHFELLIGQSPLVNSLSNPSVLKIVLDYSAILCGDVETICFTTQILLLE